MPAQTAVPSNCRPVAPAPCAVTSGTIPSMNAKEVIIIGRKRPRAPWARPRRQHTLGRGSPQARTDDQDRVLARQRNHQHDADPAAACPVGDSDARSLLPTTPSSASGMAIIMRKDLVQLS